MAESRFRFNPKTLRYERVRFSLWRTLIKLVSYGGVGFLFFVGLNLLQNYLIETKLEKMLTKENRALTEYKTILASQLNESNVLLGELKVEEGLLNERLFEVPAEVVSVEPKRENEQVVSNDATFKEQMLLVSQNLSDLDKKTTGYNDFFANRLHLNKGDVAGINNLPTIAPVENFAADNLVSGFGVRINPFHKGNYRHDGIDIALSKGTKVLATGNGQVSYFSNNNIEAGFGNYIEVDHGNGILTRYAHLERISVSWGQKIKQGQVIGISGSSGGSVAPHVHYEVIKNGKAVDPLSFIVEGITPAQHQQLALKSKLRNQSLD